MKEPFISLCCVTLLLLGIPAPGLSETPSSPLPPGWQAEHFEPVGYTDVDGRPAFKMTIKEKNGRWYLFAAHIFHSGLTVLDVTDPWHPRPIRFLPEDESTFTLQVDQANDILITSLEKNFLDPRAEGKPFKEGVVIWDIQDPENPRRLGQFETGGTGTHRNFYAGGRYMHLAAGMPGYKGNIYVIVDISDPANPVEAGRWWVKGQHEAGGETLGLGADSDPVNHGHENPHDHGLCATDADISLHGPPYIVGDRAYLPYGSAGLVILDIGNVKKPRQLGRLDFSPPFNSKFGVHSVLPFKGETLAYANSESVTYEKGPLHHSSLVDISNPLKPTLLGLLPEPVPPKGAPYKDFFEKGGWRGPHNINHLQHNPDVEKQQDLLYVAHFNAGLRAYDISNPRLPREVGFFMAPEPTERIGYLPHGKLVLQAEDVLVDRRGYAYVSHKNQGIWIVRYTGPRVSLPGQ
ncbi:LVIVD repeat-containing protein [Azomonas macrocytogenes]|uniref:Uncharacterized protein n=1 Tax=Azomonas macrocytogenes TaxID=69962 RepID=A0A839T5Z1_AZOMA|nr:hypothetical protein [Azomonas macrocytogenes]MBB3104240.1 hypothetical protein [Azomonas macrocytogenes]